MGLPTSISASKWPLGAPGPSGPGIGAESSGPALRVSNPSGPEFGESLMDSSEGLTTTQDEVEGDELEGGEGLEKADDVVVLLGGQGHTPKS